MRSLLIFLLLVTFNVHAKIVYIVPFSGINPHEFFNKDLSSRDECAKPFCELKKRLIQKGYKVRFYDSNKKIKRCSAVISFNSTSLDVEKSLRKIDKNRCFLFVFEPPVVMPNLYLPKVKNTFGKIFVMFDDLSHEVGYNKFYFPQPKLTMLNPVPNFCEKKLCTLIAGNKSSDHPDELYSARLASIKYFSEHSEMEFDLYGSGWDKYSAWRGRIDSKWETLKHYKFSICYENMKDQNGYITEKIFDSFVAGCVPIYYGADNITDYVPQDCFIDRRHFKSESELLHFVKNMTENEYNKYIVAIRKFLESPQAELFSIETFVNIIMSHIKS
jgi:alpha(1,3/1,4) fucosyltransferase